MAPTDVQAQPPFDLSQFPKDPKQWSQATPVTGEVFSIGFFSHLDMAAPAASRVGSGNTFGPGAGAIAFAGVMGFKSWDLLRSGPNDFWIVSGALAAGGVLIYFSVRGEPAGIAVAPAAGAIAEIAGIGGTFNWN